MSFRSFITKALGIVTDTGTKAVTGVVKDVSGTAKDVVDIRKGLVETKVAEIKVEEHESQIQKATLEDVKKYDPKRTKLTKTLESNEGYRDGYRAGYHSSEWDLWADYFGRVLLAHLSDRTVLDRPTRKHLGFIRQYNYGLIAFDNSHRILAKYHDTTKTTRDRNNRFLAHGNILEDVIRKAAKR